MEVKYINQEFAKCPSAEEYSLYLNGHGTESFITRFEQHLDNCEFCRESIDGYKLSFITGRGFSLSINQPAKKTFIIKRLIPYAAAVIVLISLVFTNPIKTKIFRKNYLAYDATVLKFNGHKKLNHKTNTEYWCISHNNKITLNDQLISVSDVDKSLQSGSKDDIVIVQVESDSEKATRDLLSKIRQNKTTPVYTYSKHKGLKKN